MHPVAQAEVVGRAVESRLSARDADLVSVVLTVRGRPGAAVRAIRGLLETASQVRTGIALELIVVECGAPPAVGVAVREELGALEGSTRAAHLRVDTRTHAAGRAVGFSASHGEVVVLLPGDARVRRGWMAPLVAAARRAGAAVPIVLDELDLIASPAALRGRPRDDARALDAADAAGTDPDVYAVDAAIAVRNRSLSPAGSAAGSVALAPAAQVSRAAAVVPAAASTARGAAPRWRIMLPSTPGHWGDDWGDTPFGEAIAAELRVLGQDAVTLRRGAQDPAERRADDVALTLRGRHRISPAPGVTNVLWVISHPDSVTGEEAAEYDKVFAASEPWCALMSRRWGRPVLPLLQATAMRPPAAPAERAPELLFVGNAGDRCRPMVLAAAEAGIPLAVYGRGWQGLLPDGAWRREHVPNEELEELYHRHAVVLADHWPDMAAQGFIANRVFDAVAAGASVLSDPVAGIETVFGNEVAVSSPAAGLTPVYERLLNRGPPPDAAERIRRQHSFATRAGQLVAACD